MPAQRQVPPHAADPDGTHDSRYLQIGSGDYATPGDLDAFSAPISALTENIDGLTIGLADTNSAATAHANLTAAHGATGAVVGTTNTQTLANKTLTTPTIASMTNAQHAHTNAASGGLVDHVSLSNKGTNTHAQIDTHIADASIHPTVLTASASIAGFNITTSPGIAVKTVAVAGAAAGDVVALGIPAAGVPGASKVIPWAYVSATDVVTIMFFNVGGSATDIPTATWKVKVFK